MSKLIADLNEAQLKAVLEADGPALVIAGAGSGKTRVLTTRIAYLLEKGVRPWEILCLTFTNKAAGEMKARVAKLLGEEYVKELWMGTFHSVFARLLRRNADHIGYTRSFTIYDSDDSLSLIKRIMNAMHITNDRITPQSVRSRISKAKNQMILPSDFANSAIDPISVVVSEVYEQYTKSLYEANAMDFDDILLKTIELFARNPNIREGYARQFRYVLVDEYQDTNRIQYSIIKQLSSFHRNLTVVGDDAQSIYAFRGADIRNILDFEKDFPDRKIFRLEQNYRSTQHILSTANAIIRGNKGQIEKTLFTKNHAGESVKIVECVDDREEAQTVVKYIQEHIHKSKLDLNDFAVLYRMNAQSRSLEDAFRRNNIAYVIIGGISFYKRKEIKDVLGYIRLLVNPADNESVIRVINFPARGIGDVTIGKLQEYANSQTRSLLDVITNDETLPGIQPRAATKLREFAALIKKYSELRDFLSPSELLRSYIDETGIPIELKTEGTDEALNRYENVKEFLSAVTEHFQINEGATIESFIEETSLYSDVDQVDDSENRVRLMTIHSAKGLEFPVVFVTGLEESIFPSSNALEEEFGIEEERRLLYVAITRAMKNCYMLFAQSRLKYGSVQYSMPSRFISEAEESDSVERIAKYSDAPRARSYTQRDDSEFSQLFDRDKSFRQPYRRTNDSYKNEKSYYSQESYRDDYSQVADGAGSSGMKRGSRVWHEAFGEGRVVEVSGKGEKAKAVVDFPTAGRKNLMLKFANLKVL
jgi:DNA helicase II / ATP-dependent DNA helicase PcrA